jgi:hypothetical protein
LRAVQSEIHGTYLTARKIKGLASLQAIDLLAAGTEFEPMTFGF